MGDKGIYIYAVRDEDSMQGFILVASESDIDVENSKAEKVGVYHIHSIKNKAYNYTVNKKITNVRLDEFMSVVDDDLYEFNEKTRTIVFDKKGYDNLIGQLMDDIDDEGKGDETSDDDDKKKKKKTATKKTSSAKTKSSGKNKGSDSESYEAADEDDDENKRKTRGRPKKVKEEVPEEDEEGDEDEEEKPKPKATRGRGRPPSKDKAAAVVAKKQKDSKKDKEENGDEEEEQNGKEDEEEDEEEAKPAPGKRGRKPGKKAAPAPAKKEEPSKRGRKAKKASESDDNEDADDEEDDEEAPKKGGKKKSVAAEKFKKGQNNPNIPDVIKVDETFEGTSNDIQDNCCSFCTNRELLRAIYTGNHTLFKKLVQSKAKISTLFAKRGPDADETILEIILQNKDRKGLDILLQALQKKSDISLASNPECSLEEVYTGFNDRFAYGVPTRKVQMARGGKEGNNAFVADINSFVETSNWHENQRLIFSLLENETEVQFLEFLRGLKDEQLTNALLEKTYVAVRAGNRKTAAYLMEQANKFGGYGFNKVHEQVLTLDDPSKMEEFRKVSATKKSTGVYSNNSYGYGGAQGIITPIHCAAINPNPEFIKKLLDMAPEFTIPDDMMRKPVHYAATCEGPGPLTYLIKQGVDTREGDKKKITPLMLACQFGRSKNVEVLLDANGKSNPDTRTRDGMRAIHYAAHYGHLECVKLMIEKGEVDVDSPGAKRMTPLHIAASRGYFELVEYLLSKGAKVTAKDKFKRSAVIHATANGHLKILSLILKKGGPFNDADSSNNYPVHYAAAYGLQACLDLLKQAGADFNPQNSWNLTPLSIAMAKGHFGMVKKLLNYPECDVNCTDVKGRTIISRATEKLNLNNIAQFEFILKDKKANPNMADLQGQSPLHYLCNLSKSAYIQKRQREDNAYHVTKKYEEEYEKIIEKATQILLDCGADINKLNLREQSPLTIAIKQKNFFILSILLKKGGLNFSFVNQIDQNIFHTLSSLILEGPSGIEQFHSLFDEVKKDKSVNIKQFVNKVDYHGFTPLLLYVKIFSENATKYKDQRFQEIKQDIFQKKGGSTNKKPTSKVASSLAGFSNDGALVQLTEKEIEKAQKQSEEELLAFEQHFQKLITFLVAQGADVEAKVQKIRKFRSSMDVEDKEEEEEKDQNQDEDEEEENNQDNEFLKDNMGNPIQKKQIKYTPEYNSYGEMNIFGLALRHLSSTYLKYIADQYPQLINNVDYLHRNHINKFIIQNSDESITNPSHKILEWLTTLKIDINQRDVLESTPLITAIAQNKYKFAKILVSHGAKPDVKDIFGKTPLIMAINSIKSNNLEFVEFLLSKGACPNFADNYGRTALHHAVNIADKGANASFDLENLLIKHQANINAQDSLGRAPLHYCFINLQDYCYNNQQYDPFETVSSLCNQSTIQIDVKDNLGKTPLHYAAQKNSTISAIYMVEKKANIDTEDNNGNTPLSIAFRFKRSEITTTFIQNKANTAKMITVNKNLKDNGEEYSEPKEPQKDMWGNPIRRHNRRNYAHYGNRNLYNYDNDWQQGGEGGDNQAIIAALLADYKLEDDTYNDLMKRKIYKEQVAAKGTDKLKFQEFRTRGDMPVGKHSYFKAAITYQWQGIAYLLLIKSNYNLFNALEDAINIDLYQLSITLLFKYPEDKTITQTNSEGQNLLHILCKRPPRDANLQVKLFDTLLDRKVDHKKADNKKNLNLHYAFQHPQLTPKLLELGLDCNTYNSEENTPFTLAIQKNAKSAIQIYSAKYKPDYTKSFKAKADGQNETLQYTPLLFQFANRNKDLNLLSTLLTNGSNINEVDSLGRNALYYAIYHNSKKLVQFILQSKKIDIKHVDNQGKNAIHYVVNPVEFGSYENLEILELLQNAKFELNQKDKDGNTPITYALQQDSKKMAEALKKLNIEAPKDKKLPKRAATSIVATADFPEEEVDYEEDSKKFSDEAGFDQFKEFFEQKNAGDKVQLDRYVAKNYKKKENYVILDENNEAYNLLMTKVDLAFGGYSKYVFYIMQIIHDKNSDVYILYTRWGQMGGMGQMQHTPFPTKEAAVKEFSKIFSQKAGNEWTNRHNFKKQEKKYQLVVFDKANDKKSFSIKPYDFENLVSKPSQLDKPIYEFIKNISNAEIFKQAYRQFALSDKHLPLTKLSKSALIEAQGILADLRDEAHEIQQLRTKLTQGNNMQRLLEKEENVLRLSNRYYELVPRNVSKWEPAHPLNYDHNIQQEQRLVENLLDFEAAIKIIMGSYTKLAIQHPLDYCFSSLGIRMKQIEVEHPEYKMIHQYMARTHKKALEPDNKVIRNIFAIERRGEAERIKQFQDYTKKLLWHGSGVQNFLSILTFGLRINGIHAQKSGSSLGDGIYFADLFSKASNYANNSDVGVESRFLLLCEVAVGKEQQIKTNDHYQKYVNANYQLLKGFNSIKLVGKQCPDEKKNLILPNGTVVPIGPIIDFNEALKQKLATQKGAKGTTAKKAAKKKGKKVAKKGPRVVATQRMTTFGKAPRKALATMAARKSAPAPLPLDISEDEDSAAEDIEEEEPLSQEEGSDDNILAGTNVTADNDDEEIIEEENEDGDGDEEDEEEEEEEDYNQNNFLYDVPQQGPKTPFHQLLTQYGNSEYVVFNAAQVRIRYLVEIRD